jgi:hypothetical protein
MSRTDLINDYNEQIEDLILDNDIKDIDTLNDLIWEMIDSDENVIYTYKAKEISKLIGDYDAFDTSDMTGERFDNWSQVAFENIYHLIYENIDIDLVLEKMNT